MAEPLWVELAGVSVARAAAALGLREARGTWSCPACGAERRGAGDPRGPVGATADKRGWRCHACGAGGDVAKLVRAAAGPLPPGADGWAAARALAVEVGLVAPGAALERAEPSGRRMTRPSPVARPVADPVPVRGLAPAVEVARLWEAAGPVDRDRAAAAWLASRALSAAVAAELDLVRALGSVDELPRWASIGRMTWRDGWRVLLPTWGPSGALVGLRARWCLLDPPKPPIGGKEIGGKEIASGPAVYADPVGRWLLERGPRARAGDLAGGPFAWRWSGAVVVCEGGPDWLTLATAEGRLAHGKPTSAILGLWAGGWTPEIGARLPPGCTVRLALHQDEAGRGYADRVRETIPAGCRLEVVR